MEKSKKKILKKNKKQSNETGISREIEEVQELLNEELDEVQGGAAPILFPKN